MVDMTKYGMSIGGKYGYNPSGEGAEDDPMDAYNGHGSHCAGIIAASWDGVGTSGVASGVKLCAVKASTTLGGFPSASILKAFVYLCEACDKGMNLKAVNCSFGGEGISNAELLLNNELGSKGAVICWASGNSKRNNDLNPLTQPPKSLSPYSIIVNACNASYQASDFTNYGINTTDLFAPGNAILSTVCENDSTYFPSVDNNRKTYDSFDPAQSAQNISIKYLETVDLSKNKEPLIYDEATFLDIINNRDEAGIRINGTESYDGDGWSYAIDAPKFKSKNERAVYLVKVPVDKNDASEISMAGMAAKSTLSKAIGWLRPILFNGSKESGKLNIEVAASDKWLRMDTVWSNFSVVLNNGMEVPYYDGAVYFAFILADFNGSYQDSALYLDCAGAGYDSLRYAYKQGTSMATPAITGAAAVMYDILMKDGSLEGLSKAEQAEAVATAMKGSTEYNTDFDGKCSSNGAFNFNVSKEDYTPVIKKTVFNEDGTITVSGNYFGTDAGTVEFGGREFKMEDENILTWTDTEIVFKPTDVWTNSVVRIFINKANGKKAYKDVLVEGANGRALFEGNITMPGEIKDSSIEAMIGLSGKIYMIPETVTDQYNSPAVNEQLWSYEPSTGKWEQHSSIPMPDQMKSGAKSTDVELTTFGNYLVVHAWIATKDDEDNSGTLDEIYVYEPSKDNWTKVDFGSLIIPMGIKVFGTDNGLFITNGYSYEEDPDMGIKLRVDNYKIYKLQMNGSFKVDSLKEAGDLENDSINDYANVNTFGNTTVFMSAQTKWMEWSDKEQKFTNIKTAKISYDVDTIGAETKEEDVVYINMLTGGALTPYGVVFAGVSGNVYTGRGFDTFYFDNTGKITDFGKNVSMADVYKAKSCYMDGYLYAFGVSYYNENKAFGRFVYTKLTKAVTPQVTLGGTEFTYNGKVQTPSVTVKAEGYTLKNGQDYTVKYTDGRKNVGKYAVTVTLKGTYTGSKTLYFKINPKSTSISKLKAAKGKGFTVNWKKQTEKMAASVISGYQIQIATNSKFTQNKKAVKVKGYKKTSKTFNKLKKNKKYYVRIRTYKTVSGTTYYSAWSKVKTVKTK